jgi:hypothetical protein
MKSFAVWMVAAVPLVAVDFAREVRPILASNCFACHGPDPGTRLAGLRLDTKEGATSARKSGTPVVPGNAQASLLFQRMTTAVEAQRMPPAYSHKTLTPQQIATIRQWIDEGAPWKEHWSYTAPVRPRLPEVADPAWARNPIDRFLRERMRQAHLEPEAEADRATLIRRVSLDLTGLPPAPAEVARFVQDSSPDAYERLVDRLLASPRYGEHRARYWLDAARYADTHGLHIDNYREMWPYRDWVIQAFNRNLPFDQFTMEQLAGDLLPRRTLDQQIASGFHRCNVTTNEAGVILDEVAAIYAKDRADTTGAVWLGLTVGCATCHDHKFDPISQRDFYALTAFFRNTTQPVMDGNVYDTPPILVVPAAADRPRWNQLESEEPAIRKRLADARQARSAGFEWWLKSPLRRQIRSPLPAWTELYRFEIGRLQSGGQLSTHTAQSAAGRAGEPGATKNEPKSDERPAFRVGESEVAGYPALFFDKRQGIELPHLTATDSGRPFSVSAWIYFPKNEDGFAVVSQSDAKDKNRGWALTIGGRLAAFRLTGDEGKSIVVRAGHLEQFKQGSWHHIAAAYDGSGEEAGLSLYVDGRALPTQGTGELNARLKGSIRNTAPLRLGQDNRTFFENGALADLRIFNRTLTEEDARLLSQWPQIQTAQHVETSRLTAEQRDALRLYYAKNFDTAYQGLAAELNRIGQERKAIRKRGAITYVMQEKPEAPFAHVLHRGQYDQPREKVQPDVPKVLPPLEGRFSKDRLGLAQWLVAADNPLTARVTVNRFWQEIFGTGLVKTADDFGSQGEPPSHPDLLDYLAVDFRENRWDVKRLLRLMVTSAAYRQSAKTTPEKLRIDPENRLLARGPRFRMDGEMVRDYALAAAGLLTPTIGGPSVKPYQPEGIWEAVAMLGSNTRFYEVDKGDKLYRRSLYTFWKRSAPPASMEIFNAPTRENCTVRRERTNTPLQALVTMNDPQFVEAARVLAERALAAAPSNADAQLDYLTDRLLARRFEGREREVARSSLQEFRRHYAGAPDLAKKLLQTGARKANPSLPVANTAALTLLANQLMNLDEVLNK